MEAEILLLSRHEEADDIATQVPETMFEFYSDGVIAAAFLATAVVAAKRMSASREHAGSETTTVITFYSLILLTASLRMMLFVVPGTVWSPYYTPHAVMAFDAEKPYWTMRFVEILLLGAGSLCLFSIFILILVYWSDILKKYFYPEDQRSKPMEIFKAFLWGLLGIQLLNAVLFLFGYYSTEGMLLVNSVTLALVSMICACEITIFSHRFQTILQTLGEINHVSTERQVKRIFWITATGILFFFTRAVLEAIFAILMVMHWHKTGTVAEVFSHTVWDSYILLKHWTELVILGLMLYILQNTPNMTGGTGVTAVGLKKNNNGYEQVPDTDTGNADLGYDYGQPAAGDADLDSPSILAV